MHTIAFTHETTGEGNPVAWGQMQHQFYWPGNAEQCEGAGRTQSENVIRQVDPPTASNPGGDLKNADDSTMV